MMEPDGEGESESERERERERERGHVPAGQSWHSEDEDIPTAMVRVEVVHALLHHSTHIELPMKKTSGSLAFTYALTVIVDPSSSLMTHV